MVNNQIPGELGEPVEKKSSKLIIIVIIGIVLIILIVGGYFLVDKYLFKEKNVEITDTCDTPGMKDFCYALETDNITGMLATCMKVNEGFSEEQCKIIIYSDFAKFTKNPLFCEKIQSEKIKQQCLKEIK